MFLPIIGPGCLSNGCMQRGLQEAVTSAHFSIVRKARSRVPRWLSSSNAASRALRTIRPQWEPAQALGMSLPLTGQVLGSSNWQQMVSHLVVGLTLTVLRALSPARRWQSFYCALNTAHRMLLLLSEPVPVLGMCNPRIGQEPGSSNW